MTGGACPHPVWKPAPGEAGDRKAIVDATSRVAEQEAIRHEGLDEVIESTSVRGIYELRDEFDFSADESIARGRPE